ncbi:MAG: ABC transporter substrate-binding protein, partial [Actinomycetota bacterium]|nr:ABC transporter substrate-binding protein [Actinomycetota bacterium]
MVLAVALPGSTLGACGENVPTGGQATHVTINVGVLPIADVAPLYLGMKRGFFAEEMLDVVPRVTGAGGIVPSVVSGDFQFGWTNTTSLVTARSKGLPLRILKRAVRGGSSPEGSSADILVKGDGPIRTAKDLEGRTISVAGLQSVSTLTANAALEKHGVDVSK